MKRKRTTTEPPEPLPIANDPLLELDGANVDEALLDACDDEDIEAMLDEELEVDDIDPEPGENKDPGEDEDDGEGEGEDFDDLSDLDDDLDDDL